MNYETWINQAENIDKTSGIKMRTRGEYEYGYPRGLVIHYTAGSRLPDYCHINAFPILNENPKLEELARDYALSTARLGKDNGHNYLVMDCLGKVYQSRPLYKHGYHAGKSSWPSVGYSVSKHFAGVEVLNAGKLEKRGGKFFTWWGSEVPSFNVRQTSEGYFQEFSAEQEIGLVNLCVWIYKNSPMHDGEKVFRLENIVGHHEVSPGRKTDPCGSLSVSMDAFRLLIKNQLGGIE